MQNLWIQTVLNKLYIRPKTWEERFLQRSFKKDSILPYKIIPTLFETKLNRAFLGDIDLKYVQNLLKLEGKGMKFKCLLSWYHRYL